MKFCHPRGARLALLSGHTALVGNEWSELDPRFHQAALAAGCHTDQGVTTPQVQAPATKSDAAVVALDEEASIRAAIITMIERKGSADFAGDFTAANNPNLNTVAGLCGFRVDKESMLKVWHSLQAEAAAGA